MVKWQQQALDKALALTLATNLLTKDSSELCAIAGSSPVLVREWIEELARWREQSRQESELFDVVIEALDAAQLPSIH